MQNAAKHQPTASEPGTSSGTGALTFTVHTGARWDHLFQHGPVAAHLELSSRVHPRIVVGFPAGNAGAVLVLTRATGTSDASATSGEVAGTGGGLGDAGESGQPIETASKAR